MNIAFISYQSCPLQKTGVLASGGMNIYVLNLANSLGKKGIKVDIYTPIHNDRDEDIINLDENIRIIHIKLRAQKTIRDFSKSILVFIKQNSLKYDLIHAHYFNSGISGIFLKKKLSIPLFITFHSLGKTKEKYAGVYDKFRIKSEEQIARLSDVIIASTELEKKDIVDNYMGDLKKIYVVPPGVNHKIFRPRNKILSRLKTGIPSRIPTLLFVGRIDPIKGVGLLIEAIGHLVSKNLLSENKFRLILIGGDIKSFHFWQNKEVIKIRQLISEKNLECCIKFIGSKPHSMLPYYYGAADVVIMPSMYESFGLVVLEAMACGSCVLVSKTGGMKYLVEENVNGRFFEMGNILDLAEKLLSLLRNTKDRKRLGDNALNTSQDYCWDKQAENISGIYQKYI